MACNEVKIFFSSEGNRSEWPVHSRGLPFLDATSAAVEDHDELFEGNDPGQKLRLGLANLGRD